MIITRGYATIQDLKDEGLEFDDEALLKLIAKAEQYVDAFCGPQSRERGDELARVVQTDGGSITLSRLPGWRGENYWQGAIVEIMAADKQELKGTRYPILGSLNETITVEDTLDLAEGDVLRLYQAGEFPRGVDVESVGGFYINTIPALIREATILQALYIDAMGDDFFNGDKQNLSSEHVEGYSYNRGDGSTSGSFLSPRARRALINGRFKRRYGELI